MTADASQEVRWVEPRRSDSERLKSFCCCEPEEPRPPYWSWRHSREWELDAQAMVRQDLPIPPRPPKYVLLAEDDVGIAAVSYFEQSGDYAYLGVIAVALRLRGRGLGRAMMKRTLDRMTERGVDQAQVEIVIESKIDPRNDHSIALMRSFGFTKQTEPDLVYDADGVAYDQGQVVLDVWSATLPLPSPPI